MAGVGPEDRGNAAIDKEKESDESGARLFPREQHSPYSEYDHGHIADGIGRLGDGIAIRI